MIMKSIRTLVASALFAATAIAPPVLAGPQIEHWTSESGARVFFIESRSLPMLDVRVDFAAGSAYEPEGLEGLAGMTRGLLETGIEGLDEQGIVEQIADTGAQIGGDTDRDRNSLVLRTLSSQTERDASVDLAARLLATPTFPETALERERNRSIAGLREALTRPATLASRAFSAGIYPEHPYGRQTTPESLARIDRDALLDFHRRHFVAANATVTIVGDIDRADAEHIAQQLTAALPRGEAAPPLPEPPMPPARIERIANPSAQAHIALGLPGMGREDPDYYPLLVGNHVLGGGGFTSRLTREVRDARGYAYSVFSFFHPHRVAGPFQIGLQTRGSQTDSALAVVSEVLAAFTADGPTEEELTAAQSNIINGFGLRLDSNRKILDHVAMIGFYGLPLDWLDTYTGHIAAVTAEQVQDAFARRIRPEHLVTIVAGGDGDRPAEATAN